MRIRHIKIKDFRGIKDRDEVVGTGGLLVSGKNGAGKTSVLRAIRAALTAQDVGADAIRLGADKAEIILDLEDVSVRRLITKKQSTVRVTTPEGDEKRSPQTLLASLLGVSPLDPIELFTSSKKDRRALILAALPLTLDRAWLDARAPGLPADFTCDGHGFDVIERARQVFYTRRTAANTLAKGAATTAARSETEAAAKESLVQPGLPTARDAQTARDKARADLAALEARQTEATRAAIRTEGTRRRIADLRATAAKERDAASKEPAPDMAHLGSERTAARLELENAFEALEIAQERHRKAEDAFTAARSLFDKAAAVVQSKSAAIARASDIEAQAKDLEETLAGMSPSAASDDEIDAARAAARDADLRVLACQSADEARAARAIATRDAATAKETADAAKLLDARVDALGAQAQADLLAASDGIEGLRIEGDDVFLDGVAIDKLSSEEQLVFAVDIVKRANAGNKLKLLVCDGLERLDPGQFALFLDHVKEGGWQLVGTKVAGGEIQFDAIGAAAPEAVRS